MSLKNSLMTLIKRKQIFKYIAALFPNDIVENTSYVSSLHCKCLNSPANLANFMRKNPLVNANAKILEEGLIKTYSTSMFIKAFEKLVSSQIADKLKILTFDDVGLFEYGDHKVFMFVDATDEHDKISGQIAIVVPICHKDASSFNAWLNKNLEKNVCIWVFADIN